MTSEPLKKLLSPNSKAGVLIAAHFLADFFGNLLPGVLPVILEHFQLPLRVGIFVIAFMGIGANFIQIPAAELDHDRRTPRTLVDGLILASLVLYIGALPGSTPVWVLALLMLLIGCGVALVHPHGLRGTQSISAVPASVMTPAFMAGGFTGAAFAPWCGAVLVGHFGLMGLLLLTIPFLFVLAGIQFCHIRLAVEAPGKNRNDRPSADDSSPWSFRTLFVIALLMNTATTVYQMLLPTYLHRLGLPLTAGGMSLMLFGIGSAAGSMSMGIWIRRHPVAPLFFAGMSAGIVMLALYLHCPVMPAACLLSFFAGATASGQYPILVALARNVSGSKLEIGARMAWIVGGTWGVANVLFAGIGQLTRWFDLGQIVYLACVFYLAALLAALAVRRSRKNYS